MEGISDGSTAGIDDQMHKGNEAATDRKWRQPLRLSQTCPRGLTNPSHTNSYHGSISYGNGTQKSLYLLL